MFPEARVAILWKSTQAGGSLGRWKTAQEHYTFEIADELKAEIAKGSGSGEAEKMKPRSKKG